MQPKIEFLSEKKLIGKHQTMTMAQNQTSELWASFMPQKNEIEMISAPVLYSVEIFEEDYFKAFNPNRAFEKWAAVEVHEYRQIPEKMETLKIPEGLYAVFLHQGPASTAGETYRYIYSEWIPASDFMLDNRPHFALMKENYRPENPDEEEEIWIPVKKK